MLNCINEVDLYCLHYVFLPRINRNLAEFKESWNNHALSSEGNKTPYQLFFEGLHHALNHSDYSLGLTDEAANLDVSELTGDHVHVPRISFVPCSGLLLNMSVINPLQSCSDNGIAIYNHAIQITGQHLANGCNQCSVSR